MATQKKILHLEDDEGWIKIVKKALPGYEVFSAHSIPEAVRAYHNQEFDAAILDISLIPEDSQDSQGEKFLYALEGLKVLPGRRIVILSAYLVAEEHQDRTRKYFKFYDVADAIPKQNFSSKELKLIIDEAVKTSIDTEEKS